LQQLVPSDLGVGAVPTGRTLTNTRTRTLALITLLLTPYSLLLTPYSLLLTPYSLPLPLPLPLPSPLPLPLPQNTCLVDDDLSSFVVAASVVIGLSQHSLLRPFQCILLDPSTLGETPILPLMPDDNHYEIMMSVGATEWRKCPNNHPYAVMDCGQKNYTMKAKCPVCGAAIGGATDQDTPLFTPTRDGVRRGHCLGGLADAAEIGLGRKPVGGMFELEVKASLADHRLSPAVACLLRVVMHACMLGGCVADPVHDKAIGRWLQQHNPLTGHYL
jgi:hypothetical protein